MNHEELRELAASYALDALDDDERQAIEGHLETCPECGQELASLREAVAALAFSAPPLRAPLALRARVLASVDQRVESGAAIRPAEGGRQAGWGLALAASLAAILVGGYALAQRGHISFLEQALRESRAQTQAAQQQLAEATVQLARAQVDVRRVEATMTILASPDVVRVDLKGQPSAPAAVGRAFWSRSRGVLFTANALPALPASRVYQLWMVTAAGPRSAGLLAPDRAGRALIIASDLAADRPAAFAVTVEPAGGLPAPTGEKVLIGAL